MNSDLEGDGVSRDIFHYLWEKDELNFGPAINLPDTVIYKFGQPISWYFTSLDGRVKRKHKHNLINAKIEEEFTKRLSGCEIVACYISTDNTNNNNDNDKNNHQNSTNNLINNNNNNIKSSCIEYFNREELHNFLYNRWKETHGILQRFIEPKGTRNSIIRAIWSPKVCLLERRVNLRPLIDTRYGIYDRVVTYEGPEHLSQTAPLRGNVLPNQIQNICESIVSHIAEVSYQEYCISCMVLHFKVDASDRVWFLWSNSIRLQQQIQHPIAGYEFLSTTSNIKETSSMMDSSQKNFNNTSSSMSSKFNISLKSKDDEQQKQKQLIKNNNNKNYNDTNMINLESTLRLPSYVTFTNNIKPGTLENNNQLNNTKNRPLETALCTSCGRNIPINIIYPIAYKTIISHFEAVITTMIMDPSAQDGMIEWPPDAKTLSICGGVGFGCLKFDPNKELVDDEEVSIPPMIRYAHPKLTVEVYRKYKTDPVFLYKSSKVCEDCFLVFAELATASFQSKISRPSAFILHNFQQQTIVKPKKSNYEKKKEKEKEKKLKLEKDNEIKRKKLLKKRKQKQKELNEKNKNSSYDLRMSNSMPLLPLPLPFPFSPDHPSLNTNNNLLPSLNQQQKLIKEKENEFFNELQKQRNENFLDINENIPNSLSNLVISHDNLSYNTNDNSSNNSSTLFTKQFSKDLYNTKKNILNSKSVPNFDNSITSNDTLELDRLLRAAGANHLTSKHLKKKKSKKNLSPYKKNITNIFNQQKKKKKKKKKKMNKENKYNEEEENVEDYLNETRKLIENQLKEGSSKSKLLDFINDENTG